MITAGAEQYSLTVESAAELAAAIRALALRSGVRCVLVVDRAGRIMATAGDVLSTDLVAFASLAAADFNANEQLARLVGERGFRALVHNGENSSVHVEDVAGKAVVITLYGPETPPGLVRELAHETSRDVAGVLERMLERSRAQGRRKPLLADADDEIDRLFDW